MEKIPPYHVIVAFGESIPDAVQSRVMLALEKMLRREEGIPAEVYKETKADDSKLRRSMTLEQRAKL